MTYIEPEAPILDHLVQYQDHCSPIYVTRYQLRKTLFYILLKKNNKCIDPISCLHTELVVTRGLILDNPRYHVQEWRKIARKLGVQYRCTFPTQLTSENNRYGYNRGLSFSRQTHRRCLFNKSFICLSVLTRRHADMDIARLQVQQQSRGHGGSQARLRKWWGGDQVAPRCVILVTLFE